MNKTTVNKMIGNLGSTEKVGCPTFGLSPAWCKRGSELRKQEGTVCSHCYARKGRYVGPHVKAAHKERLEGMKHPSWPYVFAERLKGEKYFRWFDSGDLQSPAMLQRICQVCRLTPGCRHWVPTRETEIVSGFLDKGGRIPENLTIRISLDYIDDDASKKPVKGLPISVVSTKERSAEGLWDCPATFSDKHECKAHNCRRCWDRGVSAVNYRAH